MSLKSLDINNVEYMVTLHIYQQPDGTWSKQDYNSLYLSREGQFGREYTKSAYKKADRFLTEAWTEFMATRNAEIAQIEAELVHLNNEIMSVDEALEEELAKVVAIRADRDALMVREREAEEGRGSLVKRGGWPTPKDWSPKGRLPSES